MYLSVLIEPTVIRVIMDMGVNSIVQLSNRHKRQQALLGWSVRKKAESQGSAARPPSDRLGPRPGKVMPHSLALCWVQPGGLRALVVVSASTMRHFVFGSAMMDGQEAISSFT